MPYAFTIKSERNHVKYTQRTTLKFIFFEIEVIVVLRCHQVVPIKMAQTATRLTCISDVLVWISVETPAILTEVFSGFPQSFQANADNTSVGPWPLPSTSIHIHLLMLPRFVIHSLEILTALENKPHANKYVVNHSKWVLWRNVWKSLTLLGIDLKISLTLQAGRSRVRIRMRLLDFSFYLILPAALWLWGRLSL
jgi:hypothetical protein